MTNIELTSPAFENDGRMPRRFAKEGGDIAPPVSWRPPPAGTKSLVLIVEDIDIPSFLKFLFPTWIHWVVFDIPADSPGLPENIPVGAPIPGGGTQGWTSFRRLGWGGPAPVGGEHRYVFRLYALDCLLGIEAKRATKAALMSAMAGRIIGHGELVGRYAK
jgi:Raf kinase inhibitor-like YbhB/YbcL family protein